MSYRQIQPWEIPRRYWPTSRYLETYLSDTCRRCYRRIWHVDAELDHNGDSLVYCRECVIQMVLVYEVGELLGSRRPWRQGLIEEHIADFLHPSLDPRAIRRRRFEKTWSITLRMAKPKLLGYSDVLSISDLALVSHGTRIRRVAWLNSSSHSRSIRRTSLTILEIVVQYL